MLLKIPFYTVKMFLIIYTMHLNDFVVNGFDFNKAKMGQLMHVYLFDAWTWHQEILIA